MGGSRLYKLASTFNAVELPEIDTEQSADVVYLAHLDHAPSKLQRFAHTNWSFANIAFAPDIPAPTGIAIIVQNPNQDQPNSGNAYFPLAMGYVVTAVDDDTGQESRASASVQGTNDLSLKRNYNLVTWNAVTGATRYRVYKSITGGAYGWIGDTTILQFTDANITADLTDSPPIGNNPFVADDGVTTTGYCPSTVSLFEQRLLWGRSNIKPNGVWGSKSGDYENMDYSRPLKDDDSLAFAVLGRKVNAVNQMVGFGSSGLLCLTTDGTFVVNGGGANGDGYLSPSAIVSRRQSGKGVSRLNPIEADNVAFVKTSTGNEIRSIGYSFEIDGVKTTDLTIFSPHFFKGFDILWWDYLETPRSMVIAGRSDGQMLCFTWEADQQVWGWTLWETDGFVFTGCVVPENGEDRLYLGIRRTVNGVTRRYIERMSSVLWNTVSAEPVVDDGCWLDAAVKYDLDAPASVFTGLDHLEGREVRAVVDGNVVSNLLVAGGRVTLPSPLKGSRVAIGIGYSAEVETLPLAFDTQEGTNQGKQQDTGQASVRLTNTRGISAGSTETALYVLKPRSYEPYGVSNDLKNGIFDVAMTPVQANETTLLVRQDQPLPFTLTAAFLEPIVNQD